MISALPFSLQALELSRLRKEGDWVVVGLMPNPQEGVSSSRTWAWVTQPDHLETKDRLDRIAPQTRSS